MSLSTAQAFDLRAGKLQGGARELATQAFHIGITTRSAMTR
jgi:hypothetical protein